MAGDQETTENKKNGSKSLAADCSTSGWFYGKPRHEGYYWIKFKDGETMICEVYTSFKGEPPQFVFPGNHMVSEYKDLKGSQWHGPLKPPCGEM